MGASIMHSEPRGPVYLMMQRETLTQHWRAWTRSAAIRPTGGRPPRPPGGADPQMVDGARRAARRGGKSDPDHRLRRTPPPHGADDRGTRAIRRYPPCSRRTRRAISRMTVHALPASRRATRSRRPMSGCWSTSRCRGSPPTRAERQCVLGAHIDIDVLKLGSPMWTFPVICACRATAGGSSSSCSRNSKRRRRRVSRRPWRRGSIG